MGRNRKALRMQICEGDPRKRGRRKLMQALENQPKAKRGLPDCPKHLNGRARAAWRFLRTELAAMNLDHRPDALSLEGGCLAYAAAIQAEQVLDRDGPTVIEDGVTKAHPAARVRNAAWVRFTAFCDRFGLSPRARESLSIGPSDNSDEELMAMLSQPRPKKATPVPEEIH